MLTRKRGNTAGKNRDKKGQSANEAMMLITLLTFFLIVTLTAVSDDLIRASDNNYREMLQDIADVIEAEANIAFSSENGYTHTFTLPQTLNGQPYAISIINSSQIGSQANTTILSIASTRPNVPLNVTRLLPRDVLGNVVVGENTVRKEQGIVILMALPLPPPIVSSVSPSSGSTVGGTSVTIYGSDFINTPTAPTVTFGGAAASDVVWVSYSQLTAATPPHLAGAVSVVVTNPDTLSGTLVNGFTYVLPPTVSSVNPSIGPIAGGTGVTIAGSDFVSGATVSFGGAAATNVVWVSGSQLTADTPAHAAGAVDVVVTNPDGQSDTLPSGFTYAPLPTVSSVTPPIGSIAGGTGVTIAGFDFVSGAAVSFGGAAATNVVWVNDEQLTADTPPHIAGSVDIVVTNPNTLSGTLANGFMYLKANGEQCSSGGECVSGNCYVDADGDRYAPGSGTKTCQAQTQLPGTDCDDTTGAKYQMLTCYYDGDSDSYTLSSGSSVCKGASCSTPADSYKPLSSPADCYDSSANAKPGQTSYFTTHRGDGSFDYNCDSVETKLMNCLTTFSSTVACTSPMPSGNSGYSEEVASYVTQWGSSGSGDGQFNNPLAVAVDSASNVYVADYSNSRVQKFTSSGTFLAKWGSFGSGDGQFKYPGSVAADSGSNVYVLENGNSRVQKFTSSGTYITKWGSFGFGDGQFNSPWGVAVDSANNVYVADTSNSRVQKFTSSGTFLAKWGSFGSGDGQFNNPIAVAVDSSNNVYVTDKNNYRVQKFTSSGTFLAKWGSSGSGDGQFNSPWGVAVDSANNVYVADLNDNRVQKFTSSGTFLAKWGSSGSGDGQFNNPYGVAVDSASNIYIVDTSNSRIQKFIFSGIIPACGASGTYKYCKSYYSSGCSIGEESAYCGPCKTTALGLTAIRWDITQNSRTQQCN